MKMLDFARKKLSEHEHPVLSVLNTNTRAIALYTRMGWKDVYKRQANIIANATFPLFTSGLEKFDKAVAEGKLTYVCLLYTSATVPEGNEQQCSSPLRPHPVKMCLERSAERKNIKMIFR